jgi:hypothetical protein
MQATPQQIVMRTYVEPVARFVSLPCIVLSLPLHRSRGPK